MRRLQYLADPLAAVVRPLLVHRGRAHPGQWPWHGLPLLTLLHQGPAVAGVDYSTGWPLAAIELEEQPGLRLSATVVNCPREQLRVGLPVTVTWIERDGSPWYAFRPVEPGDGA